MTNTLFKLTAITAISAAGIFGLAACSTGASTDQDADTDNGGTTQMIGPVVVDVEALDGTTQMLNEGQVLDITTGDLDPADFTATIADTMVASFEAGGTEGSATFNPGITGLASGTTKVALTDTASGTVYNFTVTVG
jgi:hypothetical protein